jgi:putative copper export protein/mono/diheme cytochrome c family protein
MLARTVHFAAAAVIPGLTFFIVFIAEPAWARTLGGSDPAVAGLRRRFAAIGWVALALSVLSGFAWLILIASRLAGQPIEAAVSSGAAWKVLTQTRFGHDWLARAGIALLIALCLARFDPLRGWRSRWEGVAALLLSAAFMAGLAWAGHGGANPGLPGAIQVAGDALHLVAAAAWVGGLLPFVWVMTWALRLRSVACNAAAADVTRRFSGMGVVAVSVVLLSGISNTWFLVGSYVRLVGTTYGQLLLLKIALVVAIVAVAAVNRLALVPRLYTPSAATTALARLRRNGSVEIALAVAILAIVGTLGITPPAEHTQVQWPFAGRLSLDALTDPASRTAALAALAMVTGAAIAMLASALVRRLRWSLLAVGVLLLLAGVPRLGLFIVEAYPTSFYASLTGFSVQSIAAGQSLFAQNCASCHGADGRGDGPAAANLQPSPADLTAAHVYAHSDGDLFWWITHGIGESMPPFGARLDATARWNLIDFIHANADATRFSATADAGMVNGFRMPDFTLDCPDGTSPAISELRGRVLHIVFAGTKSRERLAELEPAAIVVRLDSPEASEKPFCNSDDPDIPRVFSFYLGIPSDRLDGVELLVDESGLLRSSWHPGLVPEWTDPKVFANLVARIRRGPFGPRTTAHTHTHTHAH